MTAARHTPKNVLVTGGAGFIGANFLEYLLASDPSVNVVTLDSLTYAGSVANLDGVMSNPRHQFVKGDITAPSLSVEKSGPPSGGGGRGAGVLISR